MSSKIVLESVDDVATVWANWHQDVMLIIDEGVNAATNDVNRGNASGDPEVTLQALETVRSLLAEKPINTEYSINQKVMRSNADIIAEFTGYATQESAVSHEDGEEPCDCPVCRITAIVKQSRA